MDELPSEINIITLNCWGLKFISKLRQPRLIEIGCKIASAQPQPHIVALQEIWTEEDYRAVRRETRVILPYGKFYYGGAFGAGLAILSRWPIEESTMFQYPLNGRPTAFFRGDWYVGKGVASAKIRFGPRPRDVIEVFNTHTHAAYDSDSEDSYHIHRTAQAWELSKLLRGASERGHLVVAAGDFNMVPLSLAHRLISTHAHVRDTWSVLHPDSSVGSAEDAAEQNRRKPIPTAAFNIAENGVTGNSVYNTWRWAKSKQKKLGLGRPEIVIAPDSLDKRGQRLDYIFAGTGPVMESDNPNGRTTVGGWVVKSAKVGMTARHPELQCSLSDHFSVEATLAFHQLPTDPPLSAPLGDPPMLDTTNTLSTPVGMSGFRDYPSTLGSAHLLSEQGEVGKGDGDESEDGPVNPTALRDGAYLQLQSPTPTPSVLRFSQAATTNCDAQLLAAAAAAKTRAERANDQQFLPSATYDEILVLTQQYVQREETQRKWRGRHFFFWLVATVICYIAVWFSPVNGVSFVLMLLSSLGLMAGTVDGLMSLLFFNSELRALKEFEWEIRNYKTAASGGTVE